MLENINVDRCIDLLNMAEFFDTASCLRTPVLDFVSRLVLNMPPTLMYEECPHLLNQQDYLYFSSAKSGRFRRKISKFCDASP